MVKLTAPPCVNVPFLGVFTTVSLGWQLMLMVISPELLLVLLRSLVEDTVAVLLIAGQLALLVVAESVIVLVGLVVGEIVPKLQVNVVPPDTGLTGKHAPALVPLTVQESPEGRTSVNTTLKELA